MKVLKLFFLWVIYSLSMSINASEINYLNPSFYGFEDGGTAFWMQHNEWTISNEQTFNGSSFSLKFSSEEPVTNQKKAHGGSNNSGISISAGKYTLKFKVWVDKDAEINAFQFTLKDPWTNFVVNLDAVPTEIWTEVSIEHTFIQDVEDSGCLLTVGPDHGGKGTFYVDDIQIWGDGIVESLLIPSISRIKTKNSGNLNLPSGVYDVKMNLFVEENTTITKFYTQVDQPCVSQAWEIGNLNKNQWVEVINEMIFNEDVENSVFEVFVNNLPEFGGGEGRLYIDDVEFVYKQPVTILDNQLFDLKVYPNPATSILYIEMKGRGAYKLYDMRGNLIKFSADKKCEFSISVLGLKAGVYLLQIKTEKGSVVRKVMIQ